MDATNAAGLINSVSPNNFFKEYGELLGAVIASTVALFIAAGGAEKWKRVFLKPELKVINNIQRYRQAHHVWRISVKNTGNDIARDVQAMVTNITEGGKERENFVPMPLGWTHKDSDTSNIHPEQIVNLDIIEHYVNSSNKEVQLASPRGHGVADFRNIRISDQITKLEISFYESRGKALAVDIEIGYTAPLFLDARVKGHKWSLGIYKK